MSKLTAQARYKYGSKVLSEAVEYDNDETFDYNAKDYDNEFCNNNCLNCELDCPYK